MLKWWGDWAVKGTCLDAHMLIYPHMVVCSHVQMHVCSHAHMSTCFDDRTLTLMITCLDDPMLIHFDDHCWGPFVESPMERKAQWWGPQQIDYE